MGPVGAAIFVVLVVLVFAAVIHVVMRDRDKPAGKTFWAMMCFQALVSGVCVWAFATHRPVLAIGVLVATFVLPEIVLIPLRVRRARSRR